jgi:glycosyltransferase involved in cell wall biosynthesis
MQKNKPLVSLIITTKNEAAIIEKLFISLSKQTYQNTEIILVDNHSTDKTLDLAKKYTEKIFHFGPERSSQRNFGAKKSKGEYLFFLDADMELTPKVVNDCIKKVKENNLEGIVVPEESKWSNFWGEVKAFERSFYNEKGDPITDAARFFSRKVFEIVKGYDEEITGPEDWDLPDRIRECGYKIGRSDEKILHHEQNISPLILFKKKFYYGLNAHKYLSKHKISMVSPKTIFFLRPLFYQNWTKLLKHPILSLAMIFMLFIELLGGGSGYFIGRIKN